MKNRALKNGVAYLAGKRFLTATPSSNLEKNEYGVTPIITIGG